MYCCNKCGFEYKEGKFCSECGSLLEEKNPGPLTNCPECGIDNLSSNSKFCPECGFNFKSSKKPKGLFEPQKSQTKQKLTIPKKIKYTFYGLVALFLIAIIIPQIDREDSYEDYIQDEINHVFVLQSDFFIENNRYAKNLIELKHEYLHSKISIEITEANDTCYELWGTHTELNKTYFSSCNGEIITKDKGNL